jgi:hypothetical protein
MKKQRGTAEAGLVKALLLAIGLATVARAGISYLPLTGPLPMRVLAVKSPKPLPEVAVTPLAAHDTNSSAAVENCVNDTNAIVTTSTPNDKLPPIVLSGRTAMENPFGPPIYELATPDLMGITPQMLAMYFRPAGVNTNAPAAVFPFRVGFVPPVVETEHSSHSEYNVK